MLRKYASLDSAQILSIKGSKDQAKTASLDKLSEFSDYRTEDGYLYARIRAISSRVNKNHDGWPSVELAGGKDVFERHAKTAGFTVQASDEPASQDYGYSTFLGKPIFVDHNNSDPERARGVIVDARLHVEDQRMSAHDPYYSSDDVDPEHTPPTWVELLLEVDAQSFPKLAKAIIDGGKDGKRGIDGFSMGCDVEKSVCSICKNAATAPDEYCNHVKLKGAEFDYISPKTGRKISRKSYENCYGIKFFEISAVFDPADETALTREVVANSDGGYPDAPLGAPDGINQYEELGGGEMPKCPECNTMLRRWGDNLHCFNCDKGYPVGKDGGEGATHRQDLPGVKFKHNYWPEGLPGQTPIGNEAILGPPHFGHKTAENALPQSDMMTVPQYVDTMREEEVCPVCGSNMDEGHQCEVCGYVAPPEGMDNPDLSAAQEMNDQTSPQDSPDQQMEQVHPEIPGQPSPAQVDNAPAPATNNIQPFSSVSDDMAWQAYHRHIGAINSVERPITTNPRPATNEPVEQTISDQTKPVTTRTAASMIAAVTKDNNMSGTRTAADAPAGTAADKRVDVTGVGGIMDATNENASTPEDRHGNPGTGRTVDVEGKGAVMQGTNEEASRADHQESLTTADPASDDSGFNKDKTTDDSGPTKTFDNSNEPDSAVTNVAFPTSSWKIAWGDERAFPTDDTGGDGGLSESSGAKGGAEPADPVGKADERVDLLQPVTVNNPQKGTDQWTGTGGNGVTKQQDPVTREVFAPWSSSVVQVLKIADTEVELGLITPDDKYERISELERATADELKATEQTLARVKTAGLKKSAATKQGGVGRVPSLARSASTNGNGNDTPDESVFW